MEKLPERPSEECVAYHEAGHVVAHIIVGLTFESVTIIPTEIPGGIREGHVIPILQKSTEYTLAILDYAGLIAEARYRGCLVSDCLVDFDGSDYRKCCERVDKIIASGQEPQSSKEGLHQRFKDEARAIVYTNWEWVGAIAQALLDKKTLTHEEILNTEPLEDLE